MKTKLDLMEEIIIARRKKGEAHRKGLCTDHHSELIRDLLREKEKLYNKPKKMYYDNPEIKPY